MVGKVCENYVEYVPTLASRNRHYLFQIKHIRLPLLICSIEVFGNNSNWSYILTTNIVYKSL